MVSDTCALIQDDGVPLLQLAGVVRWGLDLKLNNVSSSCIRFILNNKMATMYSSGNPEVGSNSNKNKNEFLEKLQKAWSSVKLSLGSVDSTVSASELLRLHLRIFRLVLIINII